MTSASNRHHIQQLKTSLEQYLQSPQSQHESEVIKILTEFDGLDLHLDVLKSTKIGRTVNNVKKHWRHSSAIGKLTADLVHKWKAIVKTEFPKEKENAHKLDEEEAAHSESEESRGSAATPDTDDGTNTSDETRAKSVGLLKVALKVGDQWREAADEAALTSLARHIEQAVFAEHPDPSISGTYRPRIRSFVYNIRDPNNSSLRQRLLSGSLSAEQLVHMSKDQLASGKIRKLRKSLEKETAQDHYLPDTGDPKTRELQCVECGAKDATYSVTEEQQEHDIVEVEMALCNKCGHRWKVY